MTRQSPAIRCAYPKGKTSEQRSIAGRGIVGDEGKIPDLVDYCSEDVEGSTPFQAGSRSLENW